MTIAEILPFAEAVRTNIGRVIVGKRAATDLLLTALLCGGHVLLEDVPGVGKTMLARALATSLGLRFRRLQCTPDLLPNDVVGVSIYDQRSGSFSFHPGPIFANVLLADEINRATPRTQSALLEAMGEGQATVDGATHVLEQPFLVLATQNPVEFEGTFPLPEAQLDRFLLRVRMGYPSPEEELALLTALEGAHPIDQIEPVVDGTLLPRLQRAVWGVHVAESLRDYLVRLVGASRRHPDLALGISPRGTLAIFRAAQAYAALSGRDYVIPDDLKLLCEPTLGHRLLLKPESSLRGRSAESVLQQLLQDTELRLEEQPVV